MEFISSRTSQFEYFDEVLSYPAWRGRKILDFGGNRGGFLEGAGDRVDHKDYWCLDVVRKALDEGRRKFPEARFIHYDRFNAEFNPSGVRHKAVPDLGCEFDFILAFSVFTHTHEKETLDLVGQLRQRLAPTGILAFTFTDPGYDTGLPLLPSGLYIPKLLTMLRADFPSIDIDAIVERACQSKWSILIDDQLHAAPDEDFSNQELYATSLKSYCAFYSVDYMASLFPDATILPPVGEEWQHCCVIRR